MAMHHRQSLLLLFFLSLVQHGRPLETTQTTPSCQNAHNASNSFLWAIDREPPSYLFGTIHVPYTQVWNHITDNTKQAFLRADYVYFELDLTDPYTVSDLVNCQLLPRGESLANILPRPLYRRLKRHLQYVKLMMPSWMSTDQKSRGLYADYLFNAITGNWERKRPVWIMLMVNSLTEDEIRSRGVPVLDLYLAQEAQRLGKRMGAVEKVEEQCVPLNELNLSQVVFALNHTLWQHETSRSSSSSADGSYTGDDLISHYNCGDLDSLVLSHSTAQVPHLANVSNHDQGLAIAKKIDEYFRQELIYKRNQRMALRVHELIEKNPNKSFFFAFGAGHFLGNNSVIEKLQAKGFQVENTSPQQPLYLGKNYKRRRKKQPRLLADTSTELSLPPVIITGNLQYLDPFYDRRRHRQRHGFHRGRRKGRKRNKERNRSGEEPTPTDSYHLKRPHFNDLWVRLDATSFGPNSFFMLENTADTTSSPSPKYAMYNSSSNLIDSATLMVSIVTTLCVMYVTGVVR